MQQFPSLVMKQGEKEAENYLEGRIAELFLTAKAHAFRIRQFNSWCEKKKKQGMCSYLRIDISKST